jgi:hypothetical protein
MPLELAALFAPAAPPKVQAEYIPPANATGIEHAACVCARCAALRTRGETTARHARCICGPCRRIRYAQAAFHGEVRAVEEAAEGERNSRLFRAWKRCAEATRRARQTTRAARATGRSGARWAVRDGSRAGAQMMSAHPDSLYLCICATPYAHATGHVCVGEYEIHRVREAGRGFEGVGELTE